MRVFNETAFRVSHAHSKLEPGKPFMTVVVKGTFSLVPDGICEPLPAKEQAKPGKAIKFEDEHGNSQKTDDELVAFKPRADCLFVGSAHTPDGVPVQRLEVAFGVGDMRKRLAVHGNRAWVRQPGGGVRLTEPEPFTEMPIREEYAHGGPKSRHNRHGIGFRPLGKAAGDIVRAANILDVGQSAIPWDEDRASAGFGALPKHLLPRRALAGTFDEEWQFRRRPYPPRDFDLGHLNASRSDQQVDGYLCGDEELYFENLHPDLPVMKSRLPGVRVRCFVNRTLEPARPEELEFAEVITFLDTCFVDMAAGTVTLLWCGTLEIQSMKHERVRHLLVCQEPAAASMDLSSYADLMVEKIEASTIRRPQGLSPEERQAKVDAANRKGKDRILSMLKKGKADPAVIAKIEQAKDMDGAMAVLTEWVEEIKKTLPDLPDLPNE